MDDLNLWESDLRFMAVVWDHAPVGSGRLAELCREKLGWKKSTTYNAIRRMEEKGLITNVNATVAVAVPRERVQAAQSGRFVERAFEGSLPLFLASFLNGRALSDGEAEELKRLIDRHREG